MKILMVNKFHYLKGGSEKYYFELAELLKENGHEIAFFSMRDKKNIKTDCKEYFVDDIDLNSNNKFKALDVIYSRKNKKKMKEAIEDFKPDIVHLNNFQRQLSASIIKPIKKKNIPIVFTAHDLQAVCPNITMIDSNKKICEDCINGKYKNCVRKKCIKNSKLKSLLGAIEGYYYRTKKIYSKIIDCIITPTNFYKEKLVEDGIPEEKIQAIHNFIDINNYNLDTKDEGYALYFGRLSKEKGILNLIKAFSKLDKGNLYIAGQGEEKEKIEEFIKENNLEDRIKLLGFLGPDEMKEKISKCKFVVVSSIWYENCPYSILETLAIGKPVIGAKIGGIPELIDDGNTGFVYSEVEELTNKMDKLFKDDSLVEMMSKKAKEKAKEFSKDEYYKKIIEIYEKVLSKIK